MIYILDPHHRVYAYHAKSKTTAISEAVRKYDPVRPIIRASVMRDVWLQMIDRGFSLEESGPPNH